MRLRRSRAGGAERVAGRGIAALQPLAQPLHALCRAAVGEAVGDDLALRLALERVVTDRRSRAQALLGVARFEQRTAVARLGVGRPHAGEAVGLQLDPDLKGIAFARRQGLLALLDLAERAAEVLDVMADLVRDDIGL